MSDPMEISFPYIVWINYGTEGWSPRGFETLKEIEDFIESGSACGKTVVTKRMKIRVELDLNG